MPLAGKMKNVILLCVRVNWNIFSDKSLKKLVGRIVLSSEIAKEKRVLLLTEISFHLLKNRKGGMTVCLRSLKYFFRRVSEKTCGNELYLLVELPRKNCFLWIEWHSSCWIMKWVLLYVEGVLKILWNKVYFCCNEDIFILATEMTWHLLNKEIWYYFMFKESECFFRRVHVFLKYCGMICMVKDENWLLFWICFCIFHLWFETDF